MKKLLVVGVGLIAGSLAWAFRKNELFDEITGIDKSLDALKEARAKGIIDDYELDFNEKIIDADLIILGAPVEQIEVIIKKLGDSLKKDSIILDVGSTKRNVCKAARKLPDEICFIGGHPMTGSELSGVKFASSELFLDRPFILTPLEGDIVKKDKMEKVEELLVEIGAKPIVMNPDEHDYIMASISHLPHFIAFCLVDSVILGQEENHLIKELCAGGFKDSTRVSMGDSSMWSEIFLKNKDNLKVWLEKFKEHSDEIMEIIEENDKDKLIKRLEKIKNARIELKEEALNLENGEDNR